MTDTSYIEEPINPSDQVYKVKYERKQLLKDFEEKINNCLGEQEIQDYLERMPHFLPGLNDLHGGPLKSAVVAKFPFERDYVSDFAFISRHSMKLQFTFIEIENPKKSIFTKDDSLTSEFNQALQQVRDWWIWD